MGRDRACAGAEGGSGLRDQRSNTTRRESAAAAAAHYGIPHAFVGHEALVSSPDVDIVVVTVKVPAHLELVTAAMAAGKHVYCE